MSDLVRFGVAMERALLQEFDRSIAGRGYENRSEALRDLVRADLTRTAFAEGGEVAATLSVVFDAAAAEAVRGALGAGAEVTAALRVPLDERRWLEIAVVRATADRLRALQNRVSAVKGVLGCELVPAATLGGGRA